MKRILIGTLFLAVFGMALAGPPVDYQLYCDVDGLPQFVGVASLVENQLHVALIDGELDECKSEDGIVTVAGYLNGEDPSAPDAEASFLLTVGEDSETGELTFVPDLESTAETTVTVLPKVAVAGMLGAQENRANAFRMAEQARARAAEHASGPPMDVPEEEIENENEGEKGGPPMELPVPAAPGRP